MSSFQACYSCGIPNEPDLWKIHSDINHPPNQYHSAVVPAAQDVVRQGQLKMSRLRRAIWQLEYQYQDIQTVVDRHLSYLSPTTRLPDEVLLHIFQHLDRQLWTLSSICKRWRGVVISSPELWTHIRFKNVHLLKSAQEAHCRRVNLQLDRSGSRSLTMDIDASGLGGSADKPCCVKTLKRLLANLDRCTSLQLTADERTSSGFAKVLPRQAPTLPLLKSIRFVEDAWDTWGPTGFLQNTTGLTELTVDNSDFEAPVLPRIGWETVETLQLKEASLLAKTFLDILNRTPNLSRLILEDVTSDALDFDPHTLGDAELSAVSLDNLKVMELDWTDDDLAETLSHLKMPSLDKLHVNAPDHLDTIAIATFISSSGCATSVTSFSILWSPVNNELEEDWSPLIELLRFMPNIRQLGIGAPVDGGVHDISVNAMLLALERRPPASGHSSPLCPHLTELQLHRLTMKAQSLRAMVRSRTNSRLRSALNASRNSSAQGHVTSTPQTMLRRIYLANTEMVDNYTTESEPFQWLQEVHDARVIQYSTCKGHWYDSDVDGPLCRGCKVSDANPLARKSDFGLDLDSDPSFKAQLNHLGIGGEIDGLLYGYGEY